jgi:hypothetical protein
LEKVIFTLRSGRVVELKTKGASKENILRVLDEANPNTFVNDGETYLAKKEIETFTFSENE